MTSGGGGWCRTAELTREGLVGFRDKLESSAVVSRSRHRFRYGYRRVSEGGGGGRSMEDFGDGVRAEFWDLGRELLERYGLSKGESGGTMGVGGEGGDRGRDLGRRS